MIVGGAPFAINLPLDQCNIPPGINGPVAVWVTSDANPLINNVIDRDTTKQVAGPALLFVDSQPEMLGQLVRTSGTNSGSSSTTTSTITPEEASSIIAGAATQTADSSSSTGGSSSDGGANGAAAPPASTPLPAGFTGKSPDGKVTVKGLQQVPRPAASASASGTDSGSSASATDSASSTDSAAASASSISF